MRNLQLNLIFEWHLSHAQKSHKGKSSGSTLGVTFALDRKDECPPPNSGNLWGFMISDKWKAEHKKEAHTLKVNEGYPPGFPTTFTEESLNWDFEDDGLADDEDEDCTVESDSSSGSEIEEDEDTDGNARIHGH